MRYFMNVFIFSILHFSYLLCLSFVTSNELCFVLCAQFSDKDNAIWINSGCKALVYEISFLLEIPQQLTEKISDF